MIHQNQLNNLWICFYPICRNKMQLVLPVYLVVAIVSIVSLTQLVCVEAENRHAEVLEKDIVVMNEAETAVSHKVTSWTEW